MGKKKSKKNVENNLVQIESVVVDSNASREIRLASFKKQIVNPNHFMHKEITVRLSHSTSEQSIVDCLIQMGRGL